MAADFTMDSLRNRAFTRRRALVKHHKRTAYYIIITVAFTFFIGVVAGIYLYGKRHAKYDNY